MAGRGGGSLVRRSGRTGRMVACGHTKAQLVALDALARRPRRARSRPRRASRRQRRPARTGRRRASTKADTGRRSPSMRPTGSMISRTMLHQLRAAGELVTVGRRPRRRPTRRAPRTCTKAVTPASMALMVHVHDVLALLQVGLRGGVLHVLDGLLLGHDVGQREERRLQDGVGALAHADLAGQVDGVDGVELDVVLRRCSASPRRAGGAPAPRATTGS